MKPNHRQPLFIVTGASCVGKSTTCNLLFLNERDYIVLESDMLWNSVYDTPDDNYCAYRRMWMTVAANVAQIGKPVVLCGSADPEQFEHQPEREYFTDIHYLAIVCDDAAMEKRMRSGRKVTDEGWIQSSLAFNAWLKENAFQTAPNITLIDNTNLSPEETAKIVHEWIMQRI